MEEGTLNTRWRTESAPVLDQNGNVIYAPESARPRRAGIRAEVRVYRGTWWLPIALGIGIPALFVFGVFVFTLLMTLGIVYFLARAMFGRPAGST